MPDVLNSLDVLVSLSGGSVMYEAMSCGLCVVSAGFTKPGESIHLRNGETGIVTPTCGIGLAPPREPGPSRGSRTPRLCHERWHSTIVCWVCGGNKGLS